MMIACVPCSLNKNMQAIQIVTTPTTPAPLEPALTLYLATGYNREDENYSFQYRAIP